ncbi:MAG: glycosyltransferase family 4 protein [Candidatus Eisenbacteria bacterium]|nr:glycosyltransferase family 4 protein [Candidatus Eisenbacteria bacterium]
MNVTMFLFHTFRNDHRVLKEARSLIGAGHRVTLIAIREETKSPEWSTEEGIRVRRIRLHRWPSPKGRYAEYFLRAAWAARATHADVYHAHDLDTLFPAVLASRFGRKPVVYDSHELFTETHFLIGREREKRIWSALERRLIRHARRVVTVSEPIAEELSKRYGILRPVVIRNCPVYHPPPAPRPLFTEKPGEPLFLCQGYLQEGRGLETLVRAMAFVPRGRLLLLGDGDRMREELERLVRETGVSERVLFQPAVPIEDLPSRTASATIGLIAYTAASLNFLYALPNKFFEYIMAGVPVLSTDLPELRRLIEQHGVGEIVEPSTPEAFAGAMNRLAADPDHLGRLRKRCLDAARTLHWGEEEKKLIHLYGEFEEQGSRRAG